MGRHLVRFALAALLCALAVAVPASTTASASPVLNAGAFTAAADCPAGSTLVTMADSSFTPMDLTVQPGTTVCWTNGGALHHTVTSDPSAPESFDSSDMAPLATFSYTFANVGVFGYHCTYHEIMGMTGTVTVSTGGPPPPPPPPHPRRHLLRPRRLSLRRLPARSSQPSARTTAPTSR